jgi:hypothetical protein
MSDEHQKHLRSQVKHVSVNNWNYTEREQIVLTICRIAHRRLTHSYLLNNEERQECVPCNSNYSLKHVLLDCVDVSDVRQTFYMTVRTRSLNFQLWNVIRVISYAFAGPSYLASVLKYMLLLKA